MSHLQHVTLGMAPNEHGIYDLYVDKNGDLAMARYAQAVAQHVRQRLMTFQGEWFLDTRAGVVWLSEILAHRYNPALAEAVVKAEILGTDGVTEITAFSVAFDRSLRNLIIREVEVGTEYDVRVLL
jgi:hypothetical protein